MPLIDSPPRDSSIERGITLRQRPSRSDRQSIENSGPCMSFWTITGSSTYPTKNAIAARSGAGWMERAPLPWRGLTMTG